jgi:hypothetical protein
MSGLVPKIQGGFRYNKRDSVLGSMSRSKSGRRKSVGKKRGGGKCQGGTRKRKGKRKKKAGCGN